MIFGAGDRPKAGIVEFVGKNGGPDDSGLRICVEELIAAVQAGDVDGAVAAFKACFAECEAMPHKEGPNIK